MPFASSHVPRALSLSILGATLAACGGQAAPTDAPAPSAAPDAPGDAGPDAPPSAEPCPTRLDVIATVPIGIHRWLLPHSLRVVGETLYYVVTGSPGSTNDDSIWAIPTSGGTARSIATLDIDDFWPIDANTLLIAGNGVLSTVPIAGGTPTRIGGFDDGSVHIATYAVDATDVVMAEGIDASFQVWRLPRSGAAPTALLSAPPAGTVLGGSPVVIDDESAYLLDETTKRILELPLTGGATTPLTGNVGYEGIPTGVLAAAGGAVYATVPDPTYGASIFARYGLGDAGPTAIDAILSPQAAAIDDGSLFVAAVSTAGAPPGEYSGTAVWQYDAATRATRLVACGPIASGGNALLASAVAVDASNVYVAFLAGTDHWVLMRGPR